jgi:hypothetical protein
MNKKIKTFGPESNYKSLDHARVESKILEEEFQNGLHLVDKVQKRKASMIKELEEEVSYQELLKAKLKFLKSEYNTLSENHHKNEKLLSQAIIHRKNLQRSVIKTEKSMINMREKSRRSIIQNNFPMLMEEIQKGSGFPKEKSILLSCIQELIEVTLANEFSGIDWKARIGRTHSMIGGRVCFHNLATQKSDIHVLYSPIIKGLGQRFGHSNISIQTKTNNINGVVTKLDIKIQVPFQVKRKQLELP